MFALLKLYRRDHQKFPDKDRALNRHWVFASPSKINTNLNIIGADPIVGGFMSDFDIFLLPDFAQLLILRLSTPLQ